MDNTFKIEISLPPRQMLVIYDKVIRNINKQLQLLLDSRPDIVTLAKTRYEKSRVLLG